MIDQPPSGGAPNPPAWLTWMTLFLTAGFALGYWYSLGRPVTLAEPVSVAANGGNGGGMRFDCLSYAPFRRPGESPFNAGTFVPPERLRQDLLLLQPITRCVRIYSVHQGLEAVPAIARDLGIKVMLGAWIGRDKAENDRELALAFKLANQYPDVVSALIVGNEVLLRREQPPEVIAEYLDRARAAVKVPVTYADVWEFWVRNTQLVPKVSFATIHILPYWEDDPVPIAEAVPHVLNIVRHVREVMPGVPLTIGETGWPSVGRARHGAVPSLVNQARFAREFAIEAPRLGVPYNFIEAYDQPWKRRLEGAMGGYWGLLDSDGLQKFPVRGPVIEDPGWTRGMWAGLAGALAVLLLGAWIRQKGPRNNHAPVAQGPETWLALALAGAAAGAIGMAQWVYMTQWNRTWLEWSVTGLFALAAMALWLLAVFTGKVVAGADADDGPAAGGWSAGRRPDRTFALLRLTILIGATALVLLHVFDARYRGFPWPLYLLPAGAFLLSLGRRRPFWRDGLDERMLASLIVLGSLWMARAEGIGNQQAVLFVSLLILMASLSIGFDYRWLRWRVSTSKPATTPTTANS